MFGAMIHTVPRADRDVSIRQATLADAEHLRLFKRIALAETEYLLQGLEDYDDRLETERDLISRFLHQANCVLFIAVAQGRVVGQCSVVGGHLWRTRHVGTLSLGVLSSHWRRGIGARLMWTAIQWAQDNPVLHKLALQVHASNLPARRLYLGLGFVEEGVLRGEARLGDGYDDLVPMARSISRGGEDR